MDLKFSAKVRYIDFSGNVVYTNYDICAKDKDNGIEIVRELFIMEYGVANSVEISIRPITISQDDMISLLKVKETVFDKLVMTFNGRSYKDFLSFYTRFEGFNAKLCIYDNSYFWFKFMNLVIKAVFDNDGNCYLDTGELYYLDSLGRKIVVRNNWSEYYYGEGVV